MKDLAKQVGLIISKKRKYFGIAQDKLAMMAEIDRSYLGRIERGEVNITLEKLYTLAKVLQCPPAELLPNEDD